MANRFSVDAVFRVIDRMTGPIKSMGRSLSGFAKGVNRNMRALNRTLDTTTKKINQTAKATLRLATVGVGVLTGAIVGLMREFSKVENAQAAFTPLLGGVENAKKAVADLNETAATTPFQFEALAKAGKTLLGFGAATQETLIPTLRMLGDTAGGSSERLDRISLAFGQIKAGGRATMQDVNQLVNNGIPILGELAEMWGLNVGQARELVSQGRATSAEVEKAFVNMTSEGGKFFRGMEIASKTTTGLLSTLKDNISLTAAAIGEQMAPFVKDYIKQAIDAAGATRKWVEENKVMIGQRIGKTIEFVTENFTNFAKIIKGLIQLYALLIAANVSLKVALIANITITAAYNLVLGIMNGLMAKNLILANASKIAIVGWAIGIGIAKTAMVAFSVVMGAARIAAIGFGIALTLNPIGAIVAAVGLLIAALALLILNFDKVKSAVTGAMEFVANKISSVVDSIKAPLDLLFSPFKNIFEGGRGLLASIDENLNIDNNSPDVVTPQERVAQTIDETRTTSTAEVTIRDESGKAEVTKNNTGKSASVSLLQSGAT